MIREQVDRISRIIRQLLDFARQRDTQRSLVDLGKLTQTTVDMLHSSVIKKSRTTLSFKNGPGQHTATVNPTQIQQVLTNLIVNGAHAMPDGGVVTVTLSSRHTNPPSDMNSKEGEYICLCVEDQGEGIAEENMQRVFEPFFTTKEVGEGTGLGLSVAYGIVKEHGGWIDVDSVIGKGSRFSVFLPRTAS